jgi:hypothetical protein
MESTLMLMGVLMDDEELIEMVLLFELQRSTRVFLSQPTIPTIRYDSEHVSDSDALHSMRFTVSEIHILVHEMKLPDIIHTKGHSGYRLYAFEGVAMLCHRLAYPTRLRSLVATFGRCPAALSTIINYMAQYLAHRFRFVLSWDANRLSPLVPQFADAIHRAGAPLQRVAYFLDGKKVQISRPVRDQRVAYSGHKRIHCESYHALTTPDGIICHIHGPVRGRHHDVWVMDDSKLSFHLAQPPFAQYYAYADQGYSPRANLQVPYKGTQLLPYQRHFNVAMSSTRIAVEWGFGRVSSLWSFTSSSRMMCSLKSPTGSYFKVAVLLTNLRTSLHEGNQISDRFENFKPPTVREYLQNGFH